MNQIKIGEFIKSLRKARGLSQQEVADALYVTQKTVSRWENGEGIPDISIIKDVANFFDITVDELLNGEKNSKEQSSSTIKRKEMDRTNIITNRITNSLNIFLMTALGVYGLLILIGLILLFTINNEVAALILNLLGALAGFIIYLIGYKNNKNKVNDDLEYINIEHLNKQCRLKTLLFSDIYVSLFSVTILLIFYISFVHINFNLYSYLNFINFLCSLIILIVTYILFRSYIKDGKISKDKIKQNLTIIFSISCISIILFFIEGKQMDNHIEGVYAEYDYIPSLFFIFLKGSKSYVFRIIGIILMILSIIFTIFFTIKHKFLYTFISGVVGFIGSYITIFDYSYKFLIRGFNIHTILDPFGYVIVLFTIIVSIIQLVIYLKSRKGNENHE